MVRAYAITAEAVAAERKRVNDDLSKVDISRVIQLDSLELPKMGPRDVHLRILAVSAEHNIDHAALADTVNIAELRGGKIYPGNSAVGEVTKVGAEVTRFKPGDVVITHCNGAPDPYGLITRHGLLRERFADVLTDALRAAVLRMLGYRVDVVEFVDSAHTPRNAMLRAVRTDAPPSAETVRDYLALTSTWGVTPYLADELAAELEPVLARA